MRIIIGLSFSLIFFLACTQFAAAQERDERGFNPNSIRPINNNDQLFKRTLWWRIDGREKQNRPLYANNMEITRVIIDAVKAGILRPFMSDSLATRMPYEQFMENITIPGMDAGLTDEERAMGFTDDDGWGISDDSGGADVVAEFQPRELYMLELREDLIFDKKRSRMYHDIQALTIILPAEKNMAKGVEVRVASFRYKELVEYVFKDNPLAVWYNNQNPREHRNLADAFELRLFAAHLAKFSNGDDAYIEDIYGPDKAKLIASIQYEHQLLEWESELWEY